MKNKIVYEPIGFELFPKQFSLTDFYDLYVTILGKEIETGRLVLYAIIVVIIIGVTLNGIPEIVREYRRKRVA